MVAPAVVAGGAAAMQALPALFGRGKSDYNAQDISHSQMYDPAAGQFGSFGAENYAQGREQQARAIDRRSAPQANYMQADMDRQRALQARASQSTVMNQLMARANGQTPSIAQMQADRQMQQAAGQQAALQASARGRGALGNAATTAAANTANAAQGISGQAQVNAANERLQAEQAAFGAASGMRGQDYQSQGQAAQQAQFQAGMQLGSRQANDQRAVQTQQMGHQAQQAQAQNQVAMQGIAAQSHANAQETNAKTAQANAENKGLFESIGDFFSDFTTKNIMKGYGGLGDQGSGVQVPLAGRGLSGVGPEGRPTFASGGQMSAEGGVNTLNPMSGPAEQSFDVGSGGGMDVQASDERHKAFGTRFGNNPMAGSGMESEMIVSDDRTKLRAAFEAGVKHADMNPPGKKGGGDELPEYMQEEKRDPVTRLKYSPVDRDAHLGEAVIKQAPGYEKIPDPDSPQGWRYAEPDPPPAPSPPKAPPPKEAPKQSSISPQAVTYAKQILAMAPRITSDFTAKAPTDLPALQSGKPAAMSTWGSGGPDVGAQNGAEWSANLSAKQAREASADADAYVDPYQRVLDRERAGRAIGLRPSENDGTEDRLSSAQEERHARYMMGRNRTATQGSVDEFDLPAQPQPEQPKLQGTGEEIPMWLRAIMEGSRGLNEGQFGQRRPYSDRRAKYVVSDFSSKNAIDLDEVDVDNDPGAQDFDADEYLESKHPKPYDRREFHRDTPAEQAQVKRAFEDRAGKDADEMIANFKASLDRGSSLDHRVAESLRPSASPVAQANRTMKGAPYVYKPQFTPPDQKPGEPNFGFMAQNLEKSPITATAVKEDPNGIKRVDAMKLLRILGASVEDLQDQQDDTRRAVSVALAKGGRR